ncbi:type I-E CRISPR-associated protein Cas5/CasD [Roseateles sp. SL47]|uniref:type I-E CRISPR-associated protein Cas5/CasD n=1 Tax=Roseateles sp. SL47 TaxID=2995138 RepID=UPI00226FA81F|nr:type I-E CRISPR-associated protein Cas5/CasD [Roseateles sp. SL47]WAC73100.1 type I-E CRISPR-associated protein Cas5/CasD [Roseateles sp. SL47]
MDYLVFQLRGAMASWGEAAVGEYRGSHDYPTASALAGLLGAALGLRRDQEANLRALNSSYLYGVGIRQAGTLLRDYQTAQVPGRTALKGRRHTTRKDELSVARTDLNTILSTRDYRQDVDLLVAVQARDGAPHTLEALRNALLRPAFVLYLGRKSCPPSAPLHPCVVKADSLIDAFAAFGAATGEATPLPLVKLAWPDGMSAGTAADLTVTRKDRLMHRGSWQFGDRVEHLALLSKQEA